MVAQHAKAATWLTGKETTYGTEVASDKDWGLIQSFTPTDKRVQTKVAAAGSREVQEIVAGLVDIDFDLNLFLQHGRPIEALLGTLTHAQTSSDWKHTITAVPTTIPSYSVEYSFNGASDYIFDYLGCKLNQGTISLEKDGILTFNASGKAQTVDDSESSASAAVISTLPTLHFKHTTLSVGVAASEASVGKTQSFNLTFNNTPVMVDAAGSIFHQEHVEGLFEITFDFSIVFENLTEHKRFLGTTSSTTPAVSPTPYSIIFNAHNGVTLGSGRREFYSQLDDFQYDEVGHPLQVGEVVISTFRGSALTYGSNGTFFVDNIADTAFD